MALANRAHAEILNHSGISLGLLCEYVARPCCGRHDPRSSYGHEAYGHEDGLHTCM